MSFRSAEAVPPATGCVKPGRLWTPHVFPSFESWKPEPFGRKASSSRWRHDRPFGCPAVPCQTGFQLSSRTHVPPDSSDDTLRRRTPICVCRHAWWIGPIITFCWRCRGVVRTRQAVSSLEMNRLPAGKRSTFRPGRVAIILSWPTPRSPDILQDQRRAVSVRSSERSSTDVTCWSSSPLVAVLVMPSPGAGAISSCSKRSR